MYSLVKETKKQETPMEIQAAKRKITINEISGKSTQATRSGYNIFDKSTTNIGKTLNAQGELQGDSGSGFSPIPASIVNAGLL